MKDHNRWFQMMQKKYKYAVAHFVYLLFAVIVLFGVLIIHRIFQVQVIQHGYYKNIVENTRYTNNVLAPCGKIYDWNGKPLVSNEEDIVVQYFPIKDMDENQKWALAEKFALQFNVDEPLTLREEKDLYIYLHRKTIFQERFTKEERKVFTPAALDKEIIQRITESDFNTLSKEEKKDLKSKLQWIMQPVRV